jgi:hypothetical protein
MNSKTFSDYCPNCRQGYEILLVKFGLAGVRMITACPNCALVRGDQLDKQRQLRGWRNFWSQPLNQPATTDTPPTLGELANPVRSSTRII